MRMWILRKKLKDIEKAVEKGDFDRAVSIVKKHIQDEHGFESELLHLQRFISRYHQALIRMTRGGNREEWLESIVDAEGSLGVIREIIDDLRAKEFQLE